ncbi:insulinase family protein [Alkaliphilus serpentinus]|uniref:Insulinase family protein n=1 Tax=Alkaliphilus serpentinus TaxID=1482731 RepID=A0A833MA77_9FIRM|nr:insulinase family protein [Alkaliphilus serpentinus]KAB3531550.1 insulinase family protein [Alkaliphilus serpentinus]
MKFKINELYHGFRLMDQYSIDELNSTARVFFHEKSGARLLHLENDDDNKVFSISFRTPPADDTGVPHIVEHCVLAGSRKYKTKEPFMDMIKGSLQTFINAMTYSDKTMYPIASRNEKDFFNLMDVYLDGVFYPSMYDVPEIFWQEGWHHGIKNLDDKVNYKGIVYNEMLGAYSSPTTILEAEIVKALFPNTCYQFSSGGDPDAIPSLTFEDFLDFHRKYYHPSNSYLYLYGNGDIEKQLQFIDEDYLSNFGRIEIDSSIDIQKPFSGMKEVEVKYPISKEEKEENLNYLALSYVMGDITDPENYLMKGIIKNILIESSAAPLKKALIDAGIGEDIIHIPGDSLQSTFTVVAKNTTIDQKEQFVEVVNSTLKKLVDEGIDKKLIEGCINIAEYDLREATRFPTKGLIYNIIAMESWLYDHHPTTHLKYESTLKGLREKIHTSYFEDFINERILNNPHSALVVMKPDKEIEDRKAASIEIKLVDYKASLTKEQLEALVKRNEKLEERQISPDSAETRATIPKLSADDVNPEVEKIPQEIFEKEGYTLLHHNIFTSKIAYVDFIFDVGMIGKEYIPYINLLTDIIGQVDTVTMNYSDLSNEIYLNTGGIDLKAKVYLDNNNSSLYYPKFIIKSKSIGDKVLRMLELISEITVSSKIEDKKRIKELIQQVKSRMEMSIYDMGHYVVSRRVSSYYSEARKYTEILSGLDYFWFLQDLNDGFDTNFEEIIQKLKAVYKKIFNRNNLIISVTGDEEDFKLIENNLVIVTAKLNNEGYDFKVEKIALEKANEGILSSANVQYVAKGFDFHKLGYRYTGTMRTLATILSNDYLHDRIRARGGAYGCGISFDRSGNLTAYSYRDPNITETIKVYDEIATYVQELHLDKDELTKYIIGTISRLDPALTPAMKGDIATGNYISHLSYEDLQIEKNEVLNTTIEDIKNLSKLIDESMKENYCCVLGNEGKIKENKDLFNKLVQLKK